MPHMLKNMLSNILSPSEVSHVYSAFDQIGDIVIIKIPDSLLSKKKLIADMILAHVKTAKVVFAQVSPVKGDYRVRNLEFVAGENRTTTEYKEHGCRFRVDVAKTYFSACAAFTEFSCSNSCQIPSVRGQACRPLC